MERKLSFVPLGLIQCRSGIGDNSVNNGGPSTTIIDDGPEVNLHRDYGKLPPDTDSSRVRDLFGGAKQPTTGIGLDNLILPPDPEEDDD